MKKILFSLLAIAATCAHAATLNPVQLLNPVGSTSGQVIKSTGPSTAPAWGNVSTATLTGVLTVPNGGTGWATLAAHQVLIGAGTSALTGAAPGASGTILSSTGTTADPTFQTAAALGLGTTSGTLAQFATGGAINPASTGATTPGAGKFTTLQATSTITPSSTAGIVGTTTNDSAQAGSVGEYVTATALTVATTSATPLNVTSISLTAGDWDVSGVLQIVPAGTTTIAGITVSISTTSAAVGGFGTSTFLNLPTTTGFTTGQSQAQPTPVVRLSLASTTTVYLVGQVTFATSTLTSNGLIRARRVR